MRAGRLRHKVSLTSSTGSQNEYGEVIKSDAAPIQFWAEIRPKSGKQNFIAAQHTDKTTHEIRMRYQPNIKPDMEIKYDSRIFIIEAALNPDERNRELILVCVELN